jgi:hypothetical protein
MVFSPACLSPLWRSIGSPRLWSSVRASPYSTSAFLYSPSPLKMDKENITSRARRRKHPETNRRVHAEWFKENRAYRHEGMRRLYQSISLYKRIYAFLLRYDWPLQNLTWRTHIPIKSEKSVKRACTSCGHYEVRGLRLWWQRRDVEPPLYDCFTCFRTSNPDYVVPIEYEGLALEHAYKMIKDARRLHDKAARKAATLPFESDKPH